MRIYYTTLFEWQHSQCATWVKFSAYAIVDDLIDSSFVSISWWHELGSLQFSHRGRGQDLPIKEQSFDEHLPVYWISQPPGIDGRRLERIS